MFRSYHLALISSYHLALISSYQQCLNITLVMSFCTADHAPDSPMSIQISGNDLVPVVPVFRSQARARDAGRCFPDSLFEKILKFLHDGNVVLFSLACFFKSYTKRETCSCLFA